MAMSVGMNAHMAKPVDVDLLIATLNRVTAGGDAREMRAPPRYGHSPALSRPAPPPMHIPGIDLGAALPRFGGNFASFMALFKRFESSQRASLGEVRQLLRGADRHGAIALVHRLRGVAANLGATEVAALALEVEHALRGAGDPERQLAALETALAKVLQAARELELPAQAGPAPAPAEGDLDGKLAKLLGLLQNNNLKALAEFEVLRVALAAELAPEGAAALADAVAMLSFADAARLVQDILKRRKSA